MSLKKNIKILFGLMTSQLLFSQDVIQLDRPDQTETPSIVPKNYLQFESGFSMEKTNISETILQLPSVLWKYGLTDKTELRLITEISSENEKFKFEPVTLGFKTAITEEKGIIPKTSFIGHISIFSKDSNENFRTVPSFRFTFQNSISENLSLGYNLGMEWNPEMQETYLYTITLGKSFNEKFGGYVEFYGFISPFSPSDHRFDGGITYLVNKDFIIDFSGGIGLSAISSNYFFALGVSHRFNLKK